MTEDAGQVENKAKTYKIQNDRLDYFDVDGQPLAGQQLLDKAIAEAGPKLLLSFSGGKDSIAAWLRLREDGRFQITPYYLYWVPGFSWVEDMLAYYEDFFGQHIIRLPHPYFYEMLGKAAFQPPERIATLNAVDPVQFDYADVDDLIARKLGLGAPFCAIGMRAADNLERRRMILQQGSLGVKRRRYFYPIWEYKIADVIRIIQKYQVKVSPEYVMWGHTPVSLNYDYMRPLLDHYPEDYELVRQWFPLIDLQLFRYEVIGNA